MKDNLRYFNKIVSKLKKATCKMLLRKDFENALNAISTCGQILYQANQHYADDELEEYISQIAATLPKLEKDMSIQENYKILFYDGFGLNNRGLTQIYLRALCRIGKVVYVTHQRNREQIPTILQILGDAKAEVYWLTGETHYNLMMELNSAFGEFAPNSAFLYTTPYDVSALAAFEHCAGFAARYQVNLTDHAFWLGRKAFDYCVEFRDYGASISRDEREIATEKLVKLPYYPAIDPNQAFQGYPFDCPEGSRVVFSGGALYKTLGGENRYYDMVEHLVKEFPNVIFWYAGTGNRTEMDKLVAKYPNRVFLTQERNDLHQVLKHCFFYLSTYPLCGGLMYQYAASAGKIPVTLKYDSVSDDFLLEQDKLGVDFNTLDAVKEEFNRLFNDDQYRLEKEKRVKESVLDQQTFTEQLQKLMETHSTDYAITYKKIDTKAFRGEYIKNLSKAQIAKLVGTRKTKALLWHIPVCYLWGAMLNYKNRHLG